MEIKPPDTERSSSSKVVEDSESVKLRDAVSAALREVTFELMVMVGRMVLTERVTELLASEPSLLVLLAESVKALFATEITPSAVLLAVGVKVEE